MSDIVIAAAITAIAGIISGLIAWHSQRGKAKETIKENTTEYVIPVTEYVPVPVFLEPIGWLSRFKSYGKKLLIFIIVTLFFVGIGAWMGLIIGEDDGLIIGILIGLIVSYFTIRRINQREAN